MDEMIRLDLVHRNAEFAFHIVLHSVGVPIQMIRSNIQQHGDVRSEINNAIQLEAA